MGWFACVVGAVQGYPLLGPIVTLFAAVPVVWLASRPKNEALFLASATVLGSLWDSIAIYLGAYSFTIEPATPWGYPLWMSALWLGFATTIRSSLHWLSARRWQAAFFGLVGGPMAYFGGAKLGPIALGEPLELSLGVIALAWMAVTPGLFLLSDKIQALDGGMPSESNP